MQGGARGRCFGSWHSLSLASPTAQVRSPWRYLYSKLSVPCFWLAANASVQSSTSKCQVPSAVCNIVKRDAACTVCAEANPDFMDEVEAVASPDKRVILVCNMGGNLDPTYSPSKFGMQSRRVMVPCCHLRPYSKTPLNVCRTASLLVAVRLLVTGSLFL